MRTEPLVRYKLNRVALGTRMEKPENSTSMRRQKSPLFFLSPRARNTLTPHFTDFLTDFEEKKKKKNDCFTVYHQTY